MRNIFCKILQHTQRGAVMGCHFLRAKWLKVAGKWWMPYWINTSGYKAVLNTFTFSQSLMHLGA